MSELRIEIAGGTALTPGTAIAGHVTWRVDGQPSSAELRLFWYTSGKGTDEVGVVETVVFAAPRPQDRQDFALVAPRKPFSFSGTLISIAWALELVVEPGGHVDRRDLVLSSTGREVVLRREGA